LTLGGVRAPARPEIKTLFDARGTGSASDAGIGGALRVYMDAYEDALTFGG